MRIIVLSMVFFGMLYADSTIELKKGWQLVGVPAMLRNMSVFDKKNVEIVWGFDGATQKWRGYSPDVNISAAIENSALQRLETLEPWQAVWVFSSRDWNLTFDTATLPTAVQNNKIHLYEGWNLVEVPQQSVVSGGFFGDAVVWKYGSDQQWKVNDTALNFPSIEAIRASEGVWVKSETTRTIEVDRALSQLHTFDDEASMLAYIRNMLQMQDYDTFELQEPPTVAPADAQNIASGSDSSEEGSAKDATTTNLQEAGVDEGDILKHDGLHVFSADNTNGRIVVTTFAKLMDQEYQPIAQIDMSGRHIVAMYLQQERLSVISNRTKYYISDVSSSKAQRSSIYYDPNQGFDLEVFDVSNIDNITRIAHHIIEGTYQESRLVEGRLFLISSFMPTVSYEYPKVYVDTECTDLRPAEGLLCSIENGTESTMGCNYDVTAWENNGCYEYQYDDAGAWKYDYDNPSVSSEKLIPVIDVNGNRSALVTPSQFYAPYKLNQKAGITTLSSFTVDSGSYGESISFLGNTGNYYASPTSLYLVSSEYPMFVDFMHAKEQQMIYKFSLGSSMAYEGRGFVEGWMLNQFSMSEQEGYLRVATTVGNSWWNRETKNSVYVLEHSDNALQTVGTLSGLGKAGETIHAVRFMGDRGFVVTFEQTDPLYTLDLSDPKNPKKVGELSIPGFSRYLHVVDANRVLSIGRNADAQGRQQELQVQLFDISDFANPRLADKVHIGNKGSYSEAEYNHKALAYRASDLMFGLPYQEDTYGINKGSSEYFGIYQIEGMHILPLHTVSSNNSAWGSVGRGLIFDAGTHTYGALIKGAHMICERVK